MPHGSLWLARSDCGSITKGTSDVTPLPPADKEVYTRFTNTFLWAFADLKIS